MKKLTKLMLLAVLCLLLVNPALAKDDSDQKEDDKNDQKQDHTVPDGWDNPIDDTKQYEEYIKKIDSVTKNDTCYDLMKARMDLFAYEIRYWKAITAVDSESYSELEEIQIHLQKLRLLVAKQRSKLENLKGTYAVCVEGGKTEFLQDEYTHLKEKLHWVGYQISTNDQISITDDDATNKCSKASSMLERTRKKISAYEEDIQKIFLAGKIDELYNAKEILNMAKENFAYASELDIANKNQNDEIKKMQNCMGIISECNIAGELILKAEKFSDGDTKDKSDEVDHLDAKLKIYLDILGDKKAYLINLDNKDDIKDILNEMAVKLENIARELSAIKYDYNYDPNAAEYIKDDFEKVEELLEEYDEALKNTTEKEVSDTKKKTKINKLISSARKHTKKLKTQVNKKDDEADGETEENIVKFVDQGAGYDAVTSRKAAKAYKQQGKYDNALANAYTAIQTAKIAKDVLKEVN